MGIDNVVSNSGLNPARKPVQNQSKKTEEKSEQSNAKKADSKEVQTSPKEIFAREDAIKAAENDPIPNAEEAMKLMEEAMMAILNNSKEAESAQVNLNAEKVVNLVK